MTQKNPRVRYAPSPTGYLHVGQVRTALFNYLFAKKNSGTFILRIEDTDKERSKKEYEDAIFEDVEWLGIEPDESPVHGGSHGPYRQSEQMEVYKPFLEKLIKEKKAFWCEHKPDEGAPEVFWCKEDRETGGTSGHGVIRFKNPYFDQFIKRGSITTVHFTDMVRERLDFDPSIFGDFSIARNLDSALYNFAVVIDDHRMAITHVIRGEDHIPNTPKQILLYEALGLEKPEYAHIPLVLAPDRSKLSKRKGAKSVEEYKKEGYLPEAIFNFMALLGWNPGTEKEIFTKDGLIQDFSLDRVQKSGAIFDITKLDWMNGEYIRKLSPEELRDRAREFLPKPAKKYPPEYIKNVLILEQPRLKKLSEIGERTEYFFTPPTYEKNLLVWKGASDADVRQSLKRSVKLIASLPGNASKTELAKAFFAEIGEGGDKGRVLWPLRVALSGKKASPGPFELLEVIGSKEALQRLETALKLLD